MAGEFDVLCATSAFGLGVDIPDIRRVIHDELPDSLIDYVQQSGRAGRDGNRAECLLLLEPNDLVRKAAYHSDERYLLRKLRAWWQYHRGLRQLLQVVMASPCIVEGISRAFGQGAKPCGQCSACRKGKLVHRAPVVMFRKPRHLRLWVLTWQRQVLARQRQCSAVQVISDRALGYAAHKLAFPQDAHVPEEMERLLRHFRHEKVHENS